MFTEQRKAPAQGSLGCAAGENQKPKKSSRVFHGRVIAAGARAVQLPVGRRISLPAPLCRAECRCSSPGAGGAGDCSRSFPATTGHRHCSDHDSTVM